MQAMGKKAVYIKYPIYDLEPTGPYLNKIIRSGNPQSISEHELQMWFTINRYQFEPQLKKWLEDGTIVVAEDYIGTGIAWGTAKGVDTSWLERINMYLTPEDLPILIDGHRVLTAKEQVHIHEADDDLSEKCRKVLHDLAEKYGWRTVLLQKNVDDTAAMLWEVVKGEVEGK